MNTYRPAGNAADFPGSRRFARALAGIALAGVVTLSGCATDSPAYHHYVMQGQVLSVDGDSLSVCVGEHEGAAIGQVLQVVRHVRRPAPPKSNNPSFSREDVGKVRIESLYDEHFANAVVIEGSPQVNDEVVLDHP